VAVSGQSPEAELGGAGPAGVGRPGATGAGSMAGSGSATSTGGAAPTGGAGEMNQFGAGSAAGPSARRLDRLRGASMGALVMLIVQFAVGMIVNLYATLPAADHNAGFWPAIGRALADGPAALTVHAALGLLLIVSAVALVVRAAACRYVPMIILSSIGLLAILAAAASGSRFVSTGLNSASITMSLATAVAMLCYAVSLYLLGSRRGI
jgi:hypothetical protein